MFLHVMVENPKEETDVLNRIIGQANIMRIDVLSGFNSLDGEYDFIGDYKIWDATYRLGYCFKDTGKDYDLYFPPLRVEGDRVYDMTYIEQDAATSIPDVPDDFKHCRFITKELMGMDKRFRACDSAVEGVRVIQALQEYFWLNPMNKPIYIPFNSHCQYIVDGPLTKFDDENVIVVDSSRIFRFGSIHTFYRGKLEDSLKELCVL